MLPIVLGSLPTASIKCKSSLRSGRTDLSMCSDRHWDLEVCGIPREGESTPPLTYLPYRCGWKMQDFSGSLFLLFAYFVVVVFQDQLRNKKGMEAKEKTNALQENGCGILSATSWALNSSGWD